MLVGQLEGEAQNCEHLRQFRGLLIELRTAEEPRDKIPGCGAR